MYTPVQFGQVEFVHCSHFVGNGVLTWGLSVAEQLRIPARCHVVDPHGFLSVRAKESIRHSLKKICETEGHSWLLDEPCRIFVQSVDTFSSFPFARDALVVTNDLGMLKRREVHLAFPRSETKFWRNGTRTPVFLPFGARDGAIRAASVALPLANKLGVSAMLYHSTYPDGAGHATLVPKAQEIFKELREEAAAMCVECREMFEAAATIAFGMMMRAVEHQSPIIVMARGERTIQGNHLDLVAQESPVPLLVVADR